MATLVCTCGCSEPYLIHEIPDDCNAIDYGYPYLFLLQNPGAVNTFAGTVPTVAEMEALALVATQLHVSILGPVTNGVKAEVSRVTQSGADTIDGLETVYSQTIGITAKFKNLDNTILADLASLNCFSRVRMWYVTSKGYLFGGTTGFTIPNFFSDWLHEGFGNVSYVPISFQYIIDRTKDYSANAQDDDYLTLSN